MNQFDDGLDDELDEEKAADELEDDDDKAGGGLDSGMDVDLAEDNWDSEAENE